MRSPSPTEAELADVTRRRLELLSAEIAEARRGVARPPSDEPTGSATLPSPGRHARRSVGRTGLVAGWLLDRLPPGLQGRVGLGPAELGVLALAMALGLLVAAWWVLRADDGGRLVPAAGRASSAAGPSPAALVTPESAGSPTDRALPGQTGGVVVVDITGKVRRPGIATLPAGSRVIDALKAAGGLRRGADSASVNLARPLVDGEQIVIGGPAPPTGVAASAGGGPATAPALVSLNTADQQSLESLPGVGPVTARAIIAWREENGGFRAVDELLEVSGIGEATLAELAPHVTL